MKKKKKKKNFLYACSFFWHLVYSDIFLLFEQKGVTITPNHGNFVTANNPLKDLSKLTSCRQEKQSVTYYINIQETKSSIYVQGKEGGLV